MTLLKRFGRPAAALALVVTMAACTDEADILGVGTSDPLFASYVALGNSITAGYQSSGINDSTQQQSYARLLAQQMGTRYAYPSLTYPGCAPPIVNFATGAREGGGSESTCALRDNNSVTYALNNVAVPGATSFDPISNSTSSSNPLTTFILGGKSQAARALDADPTFISVWIGNNDVLAAAASGVLVASPGISPGVTPVEQFSTNFDSLITILKRAPRLRGGVLIGVVQVAAAPIFFPAQALFNSEFKSGLDLAAGTSILIHPNCALPANNSSLISFAIISSIRSGAHPAVIACAPDPLQQPLGQVFVLTADEQTTLAATVTAYNNKIQSVAEENGWAYFDPNPALQQLKTNGCITTVPNLANLNRPFGECISLDGIHPSGRGHREIVNALISVINAKYSTSLQPVGP
jgi:lysophospholipase L1-like esterase